MIARSSLLAVFFVLLAAGCGCTDRSSIRLVHVEPPDGYQASLTDFRVQRDEYFASDPGSPLLAAEQGTFAGLDYFEADPALYFAGGIAFYAEPETLRMVTTGGTWRDAERVGFVRFRIDGSELKLQVYRLLDGSGGLFLPFLDRTSGVETYPAGRYLDLVSSTPNGPWELDFNRAYNPSCAYGEAERFACPVTPEENRLDLRIAAGEKGRQELHLDAEPG